MSYRFASIGEFCQTGTGGTPSRAKADRYYERGTIPWVKSGELRESIIVETEEHLTEEALKESNAKLVPAGALLLAMYGATVGRVGVLGIPATTNQAVCHIIPDPGIADKQYLFWSLQASLPELLSQRVGGAQPNINQSIIRRLRIPLPPLPEQRRIADILDRAESLRAKRRSALAQLDELTRAVFLDMFGDPTKNSREWPVAALGSLGKLDRGVSKHRPRNAPELLGGPYPLIQTGDIANSDGYIRSFRATYSEVGLRQSRLWPAGTLCITIAANIAETAILSMPACFPDSVVGFLPEEAHATEYIRVWFGFVRKSLEEQAPEVAQKNINLAILRELKLPVPPLPLQQEFARRVQAIDRLKSLHRQSLAELDALFQSLQYRAFRGEL